MSKFVSALQGKGSETVVTVSEAFAVGAGLAIVDHMDAVDDQGRPLPPRPLEKKPAAEKPEAEKKGSAK